MKVLFAASEVSPFAKVGGLADVVGSLPGALRRERVETRVVMPKYRVIRPELMKDAVFGQHIYRNGMEKAVCRTVFPCKGRHHILFYR